MTPEPYCGKQVNGLSVRGIVRRDLLEGIKKGHVAIVHAFLAKGADPDATDKNGGPAYSALVTRVI